MNRFSLWYLARFMPDDGAAAAAAGGGDGGAAAAGGSAGKGSEAAAAAAAAAKGGAADPELAWMGDLDENLRADQTLARYKAKDSKSALNLLASSLVTTKRMVSEGSLPLPKTDEDRARIFDALGRPKTAAEYGYKPDAKKLEAAGIGVDDKALGAFNDLAHKLGLTDAQHKAVMEHYWGSTASFAEGMLQQRDADFAAAETALKQKWPGPQFEQNRKIAQQAMAKFGGQPFLDFLDKTGLGNLPELLEFAHAAGAATMSDEELKGATEATGGMTKEQIGKRLAEINGDPALHDKRHPQHAVLMQERRQLLAWMHPDEE